MSARATFNAAMADLREEALRRGLAGAGARFRRATEEPTVELAAEQAEHRPPPGPMSDRNADLWEAGIAAAAALRGAAP